MRPLALLSMISLVLGIIFVAVSLLSWPRVSILEISTTGNAIGNILGLSIGAGLLSLALTAWLLTMHAKEVGTRMLDALHQHTHQERERTRLEGKPLSFRA